jgi:hypothetical protein
LTFQGWGGKRLEEAEESHQFVLFIKCYQNQMEMKRVGHIAHTGWMRNAYTILFGQLEGKRPL